MEDFTHKAPAPQPRRIAARLDVYSHHVRVSQFRQPVADALVEYCRQLGQIGLKRAGKGRFVRSIVKVFAGATKDREIYHFHANLLESLLTHLGHRGFFQKQLDIHYHDFYEPARADFRYHDERTPLYYQQPIIDYITDEGKTKVVTLDPGMGKTFIAMKSMSILGVRTFFCIRPMYVEKWISDIKEGFSLEKEDLMVVQGSKNLKRLTQLATEGELNAKIILCSNKTFYGYLRDYELYRDDIQHLGYACNPGDLYETLGVGLRVIDEVHQDFHLNFRQDLYAHVPKTLSLSGTLDSDDPFIERMYGVMFPIQDRYRKDEKKVFTLVDAFFYRIYNADHRVKYTQHMGRTMKTYSHVRFEKSIMRQKKLLNDYLEMVADIVQKRFVDIRLDGQKLVVYFSTVDMCTIFADRMKHRHPTLNVIRYVSEDDYEEMLEGDIIISTVKSLGTAIDIPGLRVAVLTDALSSKQANLQCMGRLRELKNWPDQNPEFIYLVCEDIEKHKEYHEKKKEVFQGKVLRHREIISDFQL